VACPSAAILADSFIRFLIADTPAVLIVEFDLSRIGPVSRTLVRKRSRSIGAAQGCGLRTAQTMVAEKTITLGRSFLFAWVYPLA
jgi:hypothetical protein